MRVAVIAGDLAACGTYRCAWPAQVVKDIRPDWEIIVPKPGTVKVMPDEYGQVFAVNGIGQLNELDLLVMQRVGTPAQYNLAKWAQSEGCAVVMDMDDAMWCIDPANSSHKAWNGPRSQFHWSWADELAKCADRITVTTRFLARRYGGLAEILPNRIPQALFELDLSDPAVEDRKWPAVGWTGFTQSHPRDLQVVGDAVRQAVLDTDLRVVALPDAQGMAKAWDLPEDLIEAYGPFPIGKDYYLGLGHLDIALVPLELTPFNSGKSSLKALECAAMGCAVIASPTQANQLLAKTVPILLAYSPKDWYSHIVRLAKDPSERLERGLLARKVIQEQHTYEVHAEQWARTWEAAVTRRRKLVGR